MEHKGILSGIRVIDCGTYIAGPASATVMSDFGADVIKIERPQGDLWRLFSRLPGTAKSDLDWCWILTSRNKRSVALDLGNDAGRDALVELVKSSDVFVTNYQAQILKKFRLMWEDLRAVNDRLIYAHLTGYGDRGDDADEPAFDALAYWARSGLMMSVVGPVPAWETIPRRCRCSARSCSASTIASGPDADRRSARRCWRAARGRTPA